MSNITITIIQSQSLKLQKINDKLFFHLSLNFIPLVLLKFIIFSFSSFLKITPNSVSLHLLFLSIP